MADDVPLHAGPTFYQVHGKQENLFFQSCYVTLDPICQFRLEQDCLCRPCVPLAQLIYLSWPVPGGGEKQDGEGMN